MTDQPRHPAGSPDGGQFAQGSGAESAATLTATASLAPEHTARLEQQVVDYIARNPAPEQGTDAFVDWSEQFIDQTSISDDEVPYLARFKNDNTPEIASATNPQPGEPYHEAFDAQAESDYLYAVLTERHLDPPALPTADPARVKELTTTGLVLEGGNAVMLAKDAGPVDGLAAARTFLGDRAGFSHLKNGYPVYSTYGGAR